MSKAPFIECLSEDPVVRALAQRAVRLLNDTGLDSTKRRAKLQQVQQELLAHQASLAEVLEKKRRRELKDQASDTAKATHAGTKVSIQQLAAMRLNCSRAVREPTNAEGTALKPPAKGALELFKTSPVANKGSSRTLYLNRPLHTKLAV